MNTNEYKGQNRYPIISLSIVKTFEHLQSQTLHGIAFKLRNIEPMEHHLIFDKKTFGGSLPWCCKPHSPPCEAGAAGGAASGAALGLTSGAIAGAALATANPDAAFLNRCVLTCQ